MFKPTHFRLKNTIHWPGCGPASELSVDNIKKVEDQGDNYLFVHASGHAVKVAKTQVTAYGVFDADDVPNLPKEDDYKDGVNDDDSDDSEGTRLGGHSAPLPTSPIQAEEGDLKDDGPYNADDYNKQSTDAQSEDSVDNTLASDDDATGSTEAPTDFDAIPPGSEIDDTDSQTLSPDPVSDTPSNPETETEAETNLDDSDDSEDSDDSDDSEGASMDEPFNPKFTLGKKTKGKRSKK